MPTLHQYDYLLAIGTIFSFLDAWNIGANDVANSFATSVSSRSLTNVQAMCIGAVMEFAGSVAVGARVAETIRTKVISTKFFTEEPSVLMLAMTCAIIGSSLYLTAATKIGLPVSTTHSIMGGVIGVGIAAVGANGINWGWSGVSQVFAAWAIAPGISGCFGAIIFLITKYGVMRRNNPVKKAMITVPIYFFITATLLAMLIVWKGASKSINLEDHEIPGVVIGVGAGVALLVCIFLLPYLWRRLVQGDWTLRWWHIFHGPLVLKRGEIPPAPEGREVVIDYYRGHATREEIEARNAATRNTSDVERSPGLTVDDKQRDDSSGDIQPEPSKEASHATVEANEPSSPKGFVGKWYTPVGLFYWAKFWFFRGVDRDVVDAQKRRDFLSGDVDAMHAEVEHFDNKAEHMYSFLQVMTATTASFTHGANDVSNAIGPYATIYLIWHTGEVSSSVPVPTWILAFGGAGIAIGLWTYGYKIMSNLGNRLTLHSPSRGFSMELGSAITIIMATRLALPVSTTQCICGATVGVGLCSGSWRSINWRMVAWIYSGWVITLPVAGLISGCLMGIILNAPRWGLGV